MAINRISCTELQREIRINTLITPTELKNKSISIDGFNLLILTESILSGGYILKSRDGVYRDMCSVHSTYKPVEKTEISIKLIGRVLNELEVGATNWYLDRPVSNSGKLKSLLLKFSIENNLQWDVSLAFAPDKILAGKEDVIITSDGWILDNVKQWFNLPEYIIKNYVEEVNIVEV